MSAYSELLSEAISSIIHVKEESDIDAFVQGKQMSFLTNVISGLEDFELICFLVVKKRRQRHAWIAGFNRDQETHYQEKGV